ncbi:MAG: hypothetical protein JJ850_08470 [Kordiimonadaceae bacterium]|nr:hypothetical protein [Kordiimonadaceae bacterium]MBO6569161.1 hypothetical protein [Kordiimonadaceae bacterium]MBO6964637.1 hypothetical protein [Kordiimonadaceae bacterium]
MKHISFSIALLAATTPAIAQEEPQSGAALSHQPNQYTLACLEAPTRDCAFSAALQTVIAEEFGVERSKVLVAVARSLIATGQQRQAIETLMLALDEARSVNLTLVTQEKITKIAPLLARAGDTASALALVEELEVSSAKQRTLINIAEEAMTLGDLAAANVAFSQLNNPTRAFWQRLRLLPTLPDNVLLTVDLAELETEIRASQRADRLYRGLVALSILAERRGLTTQREALLAEADEVFTGLLSTNDRALTTAYRVRLMFDGKMPSELIEGSYNLMQIHAGRVRDMETLASLADIVGIVEAGTGNIATAVRRFDAFPELPEKARYASSLRFDGRELSAEVGALLSETAEMDGVYERDLVRLQLLEGAIGNSDLDLAIRVISALEDDDNQASGLALAAPLLQ